MPRNAALRRRGGCLRYRDGRPITRRRYDYLWQRIGRHLPWAAAQQISTHWLRPTTLTWVERNFNYAPRDGEEIQQVLGRGNPNHQRHDRGHTELSPRTVFRSGAT